jgi:hypothetical protein
MNRFLLPCSLLLVLGFFAASPSLAQDQYTRIELGGQFSTIALTNSAGQGAITPGFGARFDWNFNRRLAFESEVDFFPEHRVPLPYVQGGQTLQAVFGIRAKVIQTRKLSVFGLVRPGLFHFTDTLFLSSNASTYVRQPATYFVLNLGGGLEYYATPRWVFRADIAGNPYRIPNQTSALPGGSALNLGKINDTTRFSVGVAYRSGTLIENETETHVPGNWEFGPLFSTLISAREGATEGVRTDVGAGGYFSYRFYGVFYADGDVLYFPQGTNSSGPHDGGAILQGLFGIKGGIRRNGYGIFGKARPGFQSYSQALSGITTPAGGSPANSYDRSTNFVLDLGGIVEFYPSEKSTLRLEAGDTHIYWGTRNVNINGTILPASGGKRRHSIQFVVGYGWRFW